MERPVRLRVLGGIVVVLASAGLLTSCGGGGSSSPPTTAASTAAASTKGSPASLVPSQFSNKPLVLALDDSYPPLDFRSAKGKLVGLRVDLGEAIAKELGIKLTLTSASFDSLIPGIQAGRYDMSSFNDEKSREAVVNFVDYYADGTSIIVPKGNPKDLTIHTLCGHTIAVEAGSEQQTVEGPALQKACTKAGKSLHISVFAGSSQAVLALKTGRIDAILSEQVNADYIASKSKGTLMVPNEPAIDLHPVGWAYSKKDAALGPALVAALNALKKNGTYMKIMNKWSLGPTAVTQFKINAAK